MLFNSYTFILLFLPVVLAGYALIGRLAARRTAMAWLVLASVIYYGWWNPRYVGLLLASVLANYVTGLLLGASCASRRGRVVLGLGVAANLALLGYYKYANFFVDTASALAGTHWHLEPIVLPLAISFFTFQQIAYLVDAYRGEAREYHLIDYALFVTFFPQLIAGPIVHHKEMLPQFTEPGPIRLRASDLSVGVTIFTIGLCKKVLLADEAAAHASPVFAAADALTPISTLEAWVGVLCYAMQIYFDFSGYSDMAIGAARLFGIKLPLNFHSPYKAASVAEFWRRWHITLSRFLRDYLYIPLGGNRKGKLRRYVNLMITMLLGGLWHGAGWTFVAWGALHGIYLCINHGWAAWLRRRRRDQQRRGTAHHLAACGLTFLAVTVAWVFFRAQTWQGAAHLLAAMIGGASSPDALAVISIKNALPLLAAMLAVVWLAPNTQQIMADYEPAWDSSPQTGRVEPGPTAAWLTWRPTPAWAVGIALAGLTALALLTKYSEFIYYDF
ncbi:MAG TPA: MBOAT family protein [Phycisphaeraceae bacterium]